MTAGARCGRRLARALAGLVLASAAACREPPPPSAGGALVLRLAPDAATEVAPASVVQALDLVAEADAWTLDGQDFGLAEPAQHALGDGPPMRIVGSLAVDQAVELACRLPRAVGEFDQVRVTGAFDGQGHVQALFLGDGRPAARSEAERVAVLGEPVVIALDVPGGPPPFDTLVLRLDGAWRRAGLRTVELVRVPAAVRLPDPAGPPRLVRLGEEARRGTGLVPGRPLVTECVVPAGASLAFSYGAPRATGGGSRGGALLVSLGEDEPSLRFPWDADAPAWRQVRVPLGAHAGRRLALRFAAETGEGGGCVLAAPRLEVAQAGPPTVTLITSDTHRGDHLGLLGRVTGLHTPTLDALASRGTWFSDCFAPTNRTNPSHVALMTATHPRDTGIVRNNAPLSPVADTLAEHFHEAGWVTMAAVSASHLGPAASGLGQGFDRVSWPVERHERPADETVDVVERWLPDAEGRPLFLWIHCFDPHWPYAPPRPLARRAVERDPPLANDHEVARALYAAEVAHVDAQLGRLLDAGRVRDGVVAFVGDHGESLGERDVWFVHHGLFSTLHVPLVLAGPGVEPAGRIDRPVSTLDLARTLLDLGGLERTPFPGRDLRREGPADGAAPGPRFTLGKDALAAAITDDGLHLVLQLRERVQPSFQRPLGHHAVELYDLRADPACTTELSTARPEDAARLRARLIAWLQAAEPRGWAGEAVDDPALLEALAQLGYAMGPSAPEGPWWVPDDCANCRRFAR